ncbi:hypothetical protein [Sulfitobacter sp. 1A13679]|uniref:hypothetical protein n=1 Tax=Sulfitobacter sp. 1A13679 TaxID=3368597 RepID=UPI0037497326
MPDQRTATVHFGANRIATGLIECISNHLEKVLLSTSTKTITRHEYVEHFRATMVASDKLGLLQGAVEPVLKHQKNLDAFKHIIISEHALLGPVSDMLTKKTMFPKAKRRVQNLDNAFSDRQLDLHLAIAPQAECWTYLLADDDIFPGPSDRAVPVHSWADLVSRITAACPRATLTVWNFEQPHQVMLPFLAALLDIDVELIDPQTRKALSQEACHHLKSAKLLSKIVQIDEELQTRMDAQYELDLIRIDAMSKVTLRNG